MNYGCVNQKRRKDRDRVCRNERERMYEKRDDVRVRW